MITIYHVYGRFIERYSKFKGFWGLALRGAFGVALRNITCKHEFDECKNCPEYKECVYARMFESSSLIKPSAKIAAVSGLEGVTNPYTLFPLYADGNKISFILSVFGEACDYENALIVAIMGAGIEGIGYDVSKATRRRFLIERIEKYTPLDGERHHVIFNTDVGYRFKDLPRTKNLLDAFEKEANIILDEKPSDILLFFKSPFRIAVNGIFTYRPSMEGIIMNLSRKYSMLCEYHDAGVPFALSEARGIKMAARKVRLTYYVIGKRIRLRKVDMRGNIKNFGEFALQGAFTYSIPSDFWKSEHAETVIRLLLLGRYLHVGKLTTAGCGKYEIFTR
ncbi:MAG: hypothetical protein B6U94_05770 [Thermofilum sp. ex4484_79]|nr:MAG: hypothetical protein B6U94_05770 [Thermofilum sp. ex4484_79]